MSRNVMIVKIGRTYTTSAGSMGVISMLGPLPALELCALVVAVPEGVARDVQGMEVEGEGEEGDVGVVEEVVEEDVVVVVDVVVDVEDVAVENMIVCSIISLWRSTMSFTHNSVAAARLPYSARYFPGILTLAETSTTINLYFGCKYCDPLNTCCGDHIDKKKKA